MLRKQNKKSYNLATRRWNYLIPLLFFFSVVVVIWPISSYSLWIDEGFTVWFASKPSLRELLYSFKTYPHMAEPLMPGYIIYMWTWVKAFGLSEYSLRLSNAPFIIVVLILLTQLPLKQVFKAAVLLLTSFSPFIWFYMNEVRPYIVLFSFSTIGILGVLFYFKGNQKLRAIGPYLAVISLLFGSFFNVLAVFTLPALVLTGILLHKEVKGQQRGFIRDWIRPVLFSIPFFLVLAGYFLWLGSMSSGESMGPGVELHEQRPSPDISNIAFVFYEFFGLSGLGPPRNILRVGPSHTTFALYLPWLVPAVLLLTSFGVCIIFFSRKSLYTKGLFLRNPYLWGFLFGLLFFFIFTFSTKFNFRGRHAIFLYPYLIFTIAFIINEMWPSNTFLKLRILFAVVFLLIWLTSDIRLRFHPEYSKDDYRSAVKTAIFMSESNVPIYWAANQRTGAYYGLYYSNIDSSILPMPPAWRRIQKVYYAADWSVEKIKSETKELRSVVLVLSKRDLFDKKGGWHSFITERKPTDMIKHNAFEIYRFDFY